MGMKLPVFRRKTSKKLKKAIHVEESAKLCFIKTKIPGFDRMFERGIPCGSSTIVSGGPGTGKTLLCLHLLYHEALEGGDCVYLSLEEAPSRLKRHMERFNFDISEVSRDKLSIFLKAGKGRLVLKRLEPIAIARSVEALLEKASGELPVDLGVLLDLIPPTFNPRMVVLDSISAMETAFSGRVEQYRIYIEQLFRYFEKLGTTSFLITETEEAPVRFSKTGVEEFLADGIIALYNYRAGRERARGIEIVKMRGEWHSTKLAEMIITKRGLVVLPNSKKTNNLIKRQGG